MEEIILIIVMAIVVEAVVEYAKSIAHGFTGGKWKTAVTQVGAIVVGVLLCVMFGADLFAVLELTPLWPPLGLVLTGIIISRGANYVSDFIKRLQGIKKE